MKPRHQPPRVRLILTLGLFALGYLLGSGLAVGHPLEGIWSFFSG